MRSASDRRRWRSAGFTLLEVLAALGLVGAVGVVATASGHALAHLGVAARAEAAGRIAAEAKLEELLSLSPDSRRSGNDTPRMGAVDLRRIWRVLDDEPAPGLTRVEVSTTWERPRLTVLTLVGVAP